MKAQKIFIATLLLILLAAALGGCSAAGQDKLNIYADDAKIAAEGDSYTFTNRVGGADEDDTLDLTYSGFTGSNSVWTVEFAESGTLTLQYQSTVKAGDFKVVLVGPEAQVLTLFEGTQAGEKTADLTAGKYTLKLVGREASGSVNLVLEVVGNATVTKLDE